MFEEEHAFMFRFFLCHLQWNPMRFPQGKIAKNGKLYNFAYHTLLQCGFCVSYWKIMNLFIGRRIYRRGEQYTAIIVTAAKAMTMMLAMKTFGGGFAIVLSLSMAGHFLWLTILIFVWKKLFLLPSICLAVVITATLHSNRKIYRIQCYYSNSNNANEYSLSQRHFVASDIFKNVSTFFSKFLELVSVFVTRQQRFYYITIPFHFCLAAFDGANCFNMRFVLVFVQLLLLRSNSVYFILIL